MTTNADQALPLPGLEDLATTNVTPLVRSLRRTIAALDDRDLLEEQHALELQAMHLLARAAEMKLATGRASTIANDVDLLLRIKSAIAGEDGEASVDEELRAAMADFNAALDRDGALEPDGAET